MPLFIPNLYSLMTQAVQFLLNKELELPKETACMKEQVVTEKIIQTKLQAELLM